MVLRNGELFVSFRVAISGLPLQTNNSLRVPLLWLAACTRVGKPVQGWFVGWEGVDGMCWVMERRIAPVEAVHARSPLTIRSPLISSY